MPNAIAPFPIDRERTPIVIAYKNTDYIADEVAPRVPVGKQEFEWIERSIPDSYTVKETLVGRTGRVNQIFTKGTLKTDSTENHFLEEPVPQDDIDNAASGEDPLGDASEFVMDQVLLAREKRIADKVFDLNLYPADQRETLSGTSQFSDFTNSDPIGVVENALSQPLLRPTHMLLGRAVFDQLKQHPKIVNAIKGEAGVVNGIARREAIADLFELEGLIVGDGWYYPTTATKARIWGKHITLFHRNPAAKLKRGGATFMLTAQFGQRATGSIADPDVGAKGGYRQRSGESVKEVVASNLAAYFIQNAVA